MKKYEVVKEKKDFDNIIHNGHFIKDKYFVIYNKDNDLNITRYGIAIGKKIGNAVVRNKIKRQVRMILTNNKKLFKNNTDYIIMIKRNVVEANYNEMNESITNLINSRREI